MTPALRRPRRRGRPDLPWAPESLVLRGAEAADRHMLKAYENGDHNCSCGVLLTDWQDARVHQVRAVLDACRVGEAFELLTSAVMSVHAFDPSSAWLERYDVLLAELGLEP